MTNYSILLWSLSYLSYFLGNPSIFSKFLAFSTIFWSENYSFVFVPSVFTWLPLLFLCFDSGSNLLWVCFSNFSFLCLGWEPSFYIVLCQKIEAETWSIIPSSSPPANYVSVLCLNISLRIFLYKIYISDG